MNAISETGPDAEWLELQRRAGETMKEWHDRVFPFDPIKAEAERLGNARLNMVAAINAYFLHNKAEGSAFRIDGGVATVRIVWDRESGS